MAIWDVFKITRKTFLNPAGWLDIDSLKALNRTIYTALKGVFKTDTPIRKESYEEALKRLNLTPKEAQETGRNYRMFALFFAIIGVVSFVYTLYILFFHHTLLGFFLGMGATALFLSQAFRYDFWAFQIHNRKLGSTFEEWKASLFKSKRNPR